MGVYNAQWESGGYAGSGNVDGLINSCKGQSAIIAGNACTVFEDMRKALALVPSAVVFGVNDIGMYLPKLDHWASLHAVEMQNWKAVRWARATTHEKTFYHSLDQKPYLDYSWEGLTPLFALSGYFAMQIAYIMGCDPIILCGCPGVVTRRFFESTPREDKRDEFGYGGGTSRSDDGIREQLIRETQRVPALRSKVFSMSGWTRAYFGGALQLQGYLKQCARETV